ncbi:AMP-binding protein [Actinomadura barringtoniae]|uniref:AMP-binding protein n=1 Tax=Actinomadura barringtoniae TaxID=1427535 RepID=A0A939P5Z7_9ACTN|nr:AMP-binding protein [Actinomadura barringtoniae]MBO2445873.1 AMP-binding protein [Actinomadura barringtoniae]
MEGNLAAALARRADTYGWRDRPLFYAGDASYSHGEVHDAAARAAGVLHAAGVRPGHRVLIALPDSPGFVSALLAAFRLGAVAVLTGPEQTPAEHAHVLADSSPQAVVCGAALAERFPSVHVLTAEDLTDEPVGVPDPVPLSSNTPAYVQYTSGTTGPPKGAVHRHTDPEAYFRALAIGALGVGPGDVIFSLSKACYPYGLGASIFFPMFCGASAVLWPEAPNVPGVLEQALRHRPTLLLTVPTVYARLVSAESIGEPVREAFSSLRAAASAGEPLLPSLADRIEDVFGCPVLDGLGSTEVGHTFISNTVTRRRRGALGVVLEPFEIEVRVENGQAAGPANPGALYVRGPSVMLEYLGRPEQTAEVLDASGWLRTGDLVHVDGDGFVHHHGRIRDQLTVSGERISPLEVERILGQHPLVVEAVVAPGAGGGAARAGGEAALRAFVVLAEGAAPTPELADELLERVRERLPEYKVPRSVTFMAELPRTRAGKIHRTALHSGRPAG